jgi:hypothetical protein
MPRSKPRRASSLKAIIFAIFFISLYFVAKVKSGVFITHTRRVLKPNLEDLFQMRQMSAANGYLGGLKG